VSESKPKLPPLASSVDASATELRKQCTRFLGGNPIVALPFLYRKIADYSESHKISADYYGVGEFLNGFEKEVATELGFESAVFLPSGTMAQLIALRVWCDQVKNQSVAFHSTSHLELNEHHAYSHLHGLKAQLIGNPDNCVLAADIEKCVGAAVALIELPQRRTGGYLPSWDELEEIKMAAKRKGMRLHLDGARLWESQPYYGKSLAAICAGFDSVYVSFYKGLEGITGAMLLGSQAFIEEARIWQRRMGGNLYQLHPYAVSAKFGMDENLGRFAGFQQKALAMGAVLKELPRLHITPPVPNACMMHLHAPVSVDEFKAFRLKIAARDKIWIGGLIGESKHGSYLEIAVGENTLKISEAEITQIFTGL
jgi:threonine aldolase